MRSFTNLTSPIKLTPAFLLTVLLLTACTTAVPSKTSAPPVDESTLLATDPCAIRLHDICGALLLHYFQHHQTPAHLEDLKASLDDDTVLMFVCPITARPYIYVRNGLTLENDPRFLFVYDAEPANDATRWAIIGTPEQGDHPLEFRVVRLPEKVFQAFLKSAQPVNP